MNRIIRIPEEFTPEWLTSILTQKGLLKSGKVVELTVTPIGTGQMGSVVRLKPEYSVAEEAAPVSLIAKLASVNEVSRRTGIQLGVYEAEVRFYQEVLNTVDIRSPDCWFAQFDPQEGWFTLLLEDLGDYEVGNVINGGTVEQARLALEQLVKLQAPRWNDPSLSNCGWLADRRRTEAFFALFPGTLPAFTKLFGPSLEPEILSLAERVIPHALEYVQSWSGPLVLQHGDYRLDNMLIGRGGQQSPLVVVDWQTVRLGPPMLDVAFYLGAGLNPQERKTQEKVLVREYYENLVAAGVKDFSWDDCWDGYRMHALYGFLIAAGAAMLVQQNERGLELFKLSLERHGSHVLELESESLQKFK